MNSTVTAVAAVSPLCVAGVANLLATLDVDLSETVPPSAAADLAGIDADLAILEEGGAAEVDLDAAVRGFLGAARGTDRFAVIVSACPTSSDVYRALAGGAAGYLTIGSELHELCGQLERVLNGATVVAPAIEATLAEEIRAEAGRVAAEDILSPRQLAIIRMAADGVPPKEIATRLSISPLTVKTHFRVIYERLGVSDRAAAVATALRQGLIE